MEIIEEVLDNEDIEEYEDVSTTIFEKYQLRPSRERIQERINFGCYTSLFKTIEEKDETRLENLFFKLVNEIVKKTKEIKISNSKINYINEVNNQDENLLFYHSKGFFDIDIYILDDYHDDEEHKTFKMTNVENKNYKNIHYITVYKIINHIYKSFYNIKIPLKFSTLECLEFYINVFELILNKREMSQDIVNRYLNDVECNNQFILFLLDID